MSFSLYRCGDDTYVAVPEGLSPPIEAVRTYGKPIRVRALAHNLYTSERWAEASAQIDLQLFAVIDAANVDDLFVLA